MACTNYSQENLAVAKAFGVYTVEAGDTLFGIADCFGLTRAQIVSFNPQIANINIIHVGQRINLRPGATATPPVNAPVINVTPNGQTSVSTVPVVPNTNTTASFKDKWGVSIGLALGVGVLAIVVITNRR